MYTVSKDVAFREVDGTILIVNLKSGSYYSLNATATFVFRLASRKTPVPEILREMCAFYEVAEDAARRDLEACLEGFLREGILVVNGGQSDAPPSE